MQKLKDQRGFSLIELALVLVMAGLVITPAISIYHQQSVEDDWDRTEAHVNSSTDELGRFRSIHGRYPCPASETAAPGDLTYGHEDCTVRAAGACADGTCTFSSNIPGQLVLSGSLPFKTLNMQERDSYDSYLSRLDYAVTLDLTSSTTFALDGGGISITDKSVTPQSIINPPDRAHFVVLSHGQNQYGSTTKSGIDGLGCLGGSLVEQENCDLDATFVSGEIENDFDDRISFFSGIALAEWQTSETNIDEIHLKNATNLAIGASVATDLSTAEQASVRTFAAQGGSVIAFSDAENPGEGRFYSERLCEFDATSATVNTKCFSPPLFAGALTPDGPLFEATTNPGSGMSCYDPASPGSVRYLAGIQNGTANCVDEIFISCPAGEFITGIDGDGKVICNTEPAPRCYTQDVTTTCGGTTSLTVEAEGIADGEYRQLYSGECRKITDYDRDYFVAQMAGFTNTGQVTSMIATLNAETRTVEDCGPNVSNSQIRDTYQCNSGTLQHHRTHEKLYPWANFPSNVNTGGGWLAETWYNGSDTSNTHYAHDCWCREDYRATTHSCTGGLTGTRVIISKHTCPQTSHQWTTIYDSSDLCGCAPYTDTELQSCLSYYNQENSTSVATGLIGDVVHTYDVTCSGGTPVRPATPTTTDTSACACPANADSVVRSYCSTGYENSWTSTYGPEVNVSNINTSNWICPATTTGGLPDPGYWGPTTSQAPTSLPVCTCDSDLTDFDYKACPSNLHGLGRKYVKEWDCTAGPTGDWEHEDDWELIEDNCKSCSWRSAGAPSSEEFPYGGSDHKVGKVCACGSSPADQCWDHGSPYDIWTSCPCEPQTD